jgi:hypothetical protein
MNPSTGSRIALLLALAALASCGGLSQARRTAAYVVALRSVLTDVRGNLPAEPLSLAGPEASALDDSTLRALAAAGVLPPLCRRVGEVLMSCGGEQRGLALSVSPLHLLKGGRVALRAVVAGHAAPGDETVIVGTPYTAYIELEPWQGSWRIVRMDRSLWPELRAT